MIGASRFSQIFRKGYKNFRNCQASANGTVIRPDFNENVKHYIIYNFAGHGKGMGEVQDDRRHQEYLFDTDPPFAITYDSNTGAGSSWEPRVADPRGRSFTLAAEVKF